jgi:tripartite-type tricarboxylate transporter receptor subunit TctC
MKLHRRKLLYLTAAAIAMSATNESGRAQDYPSRPVRLIVGFAAGGPLDTGARLIAQALAERFHQSFVVENHAGASGNIAAAEVARAGPDGYTLLVCAAANSWNAGLYQNLGFDFPGDIAPVASFNRSGGIMLASPSVPAQTIPEFITYAKANPGKINMASAGPGSAPGMYGELFKSMAGVDLVTVNYRGSAPAMPDLFAGRVQVLFEPAITGIAPVVAGKVRGLGVTSATRIAQLPGVPAIGEYVHGYVATGWQAICAPKNTPPQIIATLNKEVNAALADPGFKGQLTTLGVEPFPNSPAEFGKFVVEYTEKWRKVIQEAGLKAEQ